MNKTYKTPVVDMAKIFCDSEAIPKDRVKNYYYLIADIFGEKKLLENSIIFNEFKKCIASLEDRSKQYIVMRYGLNDSKFRTLGDIDKNITVERVRQLMLKALSDLKQQKTKYNIYYRIELLKIRREVINNEINFYEKVIDGNATIYLTLDDFNFSTRTINALGRKRITTYEQLIKLSLSDLMSIKNLGIESINEIWLELHGEEIYQYIGGGK